jgi:hypothetical protein
MRVLVCGGRDFCDDYTLNSILDAVHYLRAIDFIIHGAARGADAYAGQWAGKNNISCIIFRPDWKKHGGAAGPIRNQEMLDIAKPDLVVAFPGGRGTADMVRRANKAGIRVMEVS